MSMFDAFGTVSSSIAPVSVRRSGLRSGGQSQGEADRMLGEHVVKVDTLTVNCLKSWEFFGEISDQRDVRGRVFSSFCRE